jgi:hypothetical protein
VSGNVAGSGALGFPVPVPRRRAALFLASLAAAQLAWGGLYVWRTSFPFEGERVFSLWDDAMISMTYARNLSDGYGLVWNAGGERIQGYTNLGPTLLMAAAHAAPVARIHVSLLVQLLALLLLVSLPPLAWRVARDLFPEAAAAPPLAALSVAASATLGIWSLQGSDVAFVAPWLLAGLALLARGEASDARWPRALLPLVALGPLLRPDAALYSGIFVAAALLFPGDRRRPLLWGGLAVAGALAVFLGFGQLYYGDPLPNTWYLKATGVPRGEMFLVGFKVLAMWLPRLLPVLALAAAALALAPRRRATWAAAALVATTLAWSVWVGGDWAAGWGNRFVAPVLPVLLVLAAGGVARLADRVLAGAGRPAARRSSCRWRCSRARRSRSRSGSCRRSPRCTTRSSPAAIARRSTCAGTRPPTRAWACTGPARSSTSPAGAASTCWASPTGTSRGSWSTITTRGTRSGTGTT